MTSDERARLIEASSLGTPAAKKLRARSRDEDVAKVVDVHKPCPQCDHPFDDHSFAAIFESPMDGGIIVCPIHGCRCVSTWAVKGRMKPAMPPQSVIDQVQAQIQNRTSTGG